MFGLSLKFTKKLLELGLRPRPHWEWDWRAYDASQDPLVGSSLSRLLYPGAPKGTHGNAKCVTEKLGVGYKIRKLGYKV